MLVKCKLGNLDVLVETLKVDERTGEIITDVGFRKRAREELGDITENSFEKLMEIIPFMSNILHKTVKDLKPQPAEVSLDLSLGLTMQGGIFIAKGSVNSNLNVHLSWARKKTA